MDQENECIECEGRGLVMAICSNCNGSGEGGYDGSRCYVCNGCGGVVEPCDCGAEPTTEMNEEVDYG